MNAHVSMMGGVPKKRRRRRGSIGNGERHEEDIGTRIDAPSMFFDSRETYEIFDPRTQSRVNFMQLYVETLVGLVSTIEHGRAEITLGESGLRQLDHEIAGLTARLRVYMQWFIDDDGNVGTPDASGWTEANWIDYEQSLEGPILYWYRKAWLDSGWWANPIDGPPGHRPDLLQGWMLLSQVTISRMHQVELIGYFWGFVSLKAQQLGAEFGGDIGEIWDGIAAKALEAAENATDYIKKQLPKSPLGKLGLGVAVAAALGLGLFLFTRRRR